MIWKLSMLPISISNVYLFFFEASFPYFHIMIVLKDPFWPTRTELDTRMIFHNKKTNEFYCFDRHGEWTLESIA